MNHQQECRHCGLLKNTIDATRNECVSDTRFGFTGKRQHAYICKSVSCTKDDFNDDVCDKHQQPDCMKCWYTTRAEGKIDDTFVTDMKHIHMLRQWVNERDNSKLITTEEIITFLKLQ